MELNSFIKLLEIKKPIKDWVINCQKSCPVSIKNIFKSIIPFILIITQKKTDKFVLILTEDAHLNRRLYEQLSYMLPNKIASLSKCSLHKNKIDDIRHDKNDCISQKSVELLLKNSASFLILTTNSSNFQKINFSIFYDAPILFELNEKFDYNNIIKTLTFWGYERFSMISHPGTFSIRGCIFDIFPFGHENPIRIELDGNIIYSMRVLNPITQRKSSIITSKKYYLFPPFNSPKNKFYRKSIKKIIPSNSLTLSIIPENIENLFTIHLLIDDTTSRKGGENFINLKCIQRGPWSLKAKSELEPLKQLVNNKEINSFIFIDNPKESSLIKNVLMKNIQIIPYKSKGSFLSNVLNIFAFSCRDIYGFHVKSHIKKEIRKLSVLDDFNLGDFFVHEDYGIGIYRGLMTLKTKWGNQECIKIEYKDGDYLYVPVHNFHLIHRYIGTDNKTPQLSKLGSSLWAKQKQITKKSSEKIVKEFISLYAKRSTIKGYKFSPDSSLQEHMEKNFNYIETEGQISALREIKRDMESSKPMDRLLCGDVGFGKTELAIRASFKAVLDNKLVAVLVPTTILATQHFSSFVSRLDPYGVRIRYISRFIPTKIQKNIIQDLNKGKIDIIIGTHRLLSEDINLRNLGLLIIDEEHRFGAKHKEKIKVLKTSIDVLSMTATPIPRTFQLSLMGIRDISVINSPPLERYPINTSIITFNKKTIKTAIDFELNRKGQIYFVHNNIKTLPKILKFLVNTIPYIRIGIAHGKLPSNQLEKVVLDFIGHKFHILLCTTVIEVGIDIPNVNTIFINNSHTFGLAQLYQMRGRVGRSNRKAFCYLLIPKNIHITNKAIARLKTLEYYSSLGSGYYVAMKDLELRGAGNIFGIEQSGHIYSVGYFMYNKILKDTLKNLTNKNMRKLLNSYRETKITFKGEAFIPNNYMSDISDRIFYYRKLADSQDDEEIGDLINEIRDKFGPIPIQLKNLFYITFYRLIGKSYQIKHIYIGTDNIQFLFYKQKRDVNSMTNLHKIINKINNLNVIFYIKPFKNGNIKLIINLNNLESKINVCNIIFNLPRNIKKFTYL